MKIDFSAYKFHPSSLGELMTKSRTKELLSETCKKRLLKCYVWEKFHREKNISNRYIEKGLKAEEDSLTLYARVTQRFLKKNTETFENEFLIGTPDVVKPELIDVKTSWDIHTFYEPLIKPVDTDYFWQIQAYCALTGVDYGKLVYCLVNTPENLIQQELKSLAYRMGIDAGNGFTDQLFIEASEKIRHEMMFDDIDIHERYIEFTIKRHDEKIIEAYEKIELCRGFLNKLP